MSEKRVTVIVPDDMAKWLDDEAKKTGAGNVSSFLRIMIRRQMERAVADA